MNLNLIESLELNSAQTDAQYIDQQIENYTKDKITKTEMLERINPALKSLNREIKNLSKELK